MLKKKSKLCVQIMLLFWLCKTHTPTLNGIVSWIHRQIFFREIRWKQGRKMSIFSLVLTNLRCVFAKLLMYEHYSYKKDVWTVRLEPYSGVGLWFVQLLFKTVKRDTTQTSLANIVDLSLSLEQNIMDFKCVILYHVIIWKAIKRLLIKYKWFDTFLQRCISVDGFHGKR